MKKIISVSALALFFAAQLWAQTPDWVWAKNTANGSGNGIASDKSDNVYVIGYFDTTITLGSTVLSSPSGAGCFFAKYDLSGNVVWAKNIGGNNHGLDFLSVTVDAVGDIYLTGTFSSFVVSFDNLTLTLSDTGFVDGFIVKYNASGDLIRAKKINGTTSNINAVTDASGNFIVSGTYESIILALDSIQLTTSGSRKAFIAKYDSTGNILWANTATGSFIDGLGIDVAVDNGGNSIITGWFFSNSITFGGTTLNNAGGTDIFIVKYNPAGTMLWAKREGGTDYDWGKRLITDAAGAVYLAGEYESPTINFGSNTFTNAGNEDLFITKYNSAGNVLWAKGTGGIYSEQSSTLTIDQSGKLYLAGTYRSPSFILGSDTLTSQNTSNPKTYIAKLDTSGNIPWAISNEVYIANYGKCITNDSSGNVYLTGFFQSDSIACGNVILTLKDTDTFGGDFLIAKLSELIPVNCSASFNVYPDNGSCNGSINSSVTGGVQPFQYTWSNNDTIASLTSLCAAVYDVTITDAYGCSIDTSVTVAAQYDTSVVWPGDANDDLTANNYDLLPIGIYYGLSETARDSISNLWIGHNSINWGDTLYSGSNLTHADCNGDGIINEDDTLAINLNYGLTHVRSGGVNSRAGEPIFTLQSSQTIYLPGDTVKLDILIGDVANQVNNLYGVAFNISYNAAIAEAGSVYLFFNNSFIGNISTNLKLSKIFEQNGKADGAIVCKDQQAVSGYGKIGELRFIASNSIATLVTTNVSFTDYVAIDANGNEILFDVQPVSFQIDGVTGIGSNVTAQFFIYPNPANNLLNIATTLQGNEGVQYQIINTLGATAIANKATAKDFSIDVSALPAGIYFIHLQSGNAKTVKRFVKE